MKENITKIYDTISEGMKDHLVKMYVEIRTALYLQYKNLSSKLIYNYLHDQSTSDDENRKFPMDCPVIVQFWKQLSAKRTARSKLKLF